MSAPEEEQPCWVFTHMAKSGGTTINHLLDAWGSHVASVKNARFENYMYMQGTEYARGFGMANHTMTMGGYTETFRPYSRRHCKWFTVFRHPVSRLVSAYHYCKHIKDLLCATRIVDATKVDLVTFAEHWSNFGLRQFTQAFVPPDVVLQAGANSVARHGSFTPVWYLMKEYFNDQTQSGDGETSTVDDAMAEYLRPAMDLLSTQYVAIGLLENYNATMHLFNRALELPNWEWHTAFQRLGVKNKDSVEQSHEHAVLKLAWTDVRIKKFLWLDLLLYEHAVALHNEQLVRYGLD